MAHIVPNFSPKEIKDAIAKHKGKFFPKYQAFKVLKGKISEVETQGTSVWAVIYGNGMLSTTIKIGEPSTNHADTPPYMRKGKSPKVTIAKDQTQ